MDSEFTAGWYRFAQSSAIKKNKIYTYHYFGTSFVCFRNSEDKVSIFNAYCPHLGAHLGVGGKLKNDIITCPFHGWKYDSTGKCVEIPYCKTIPKRAMLENYKSIEMHSLIYFYYQNSQTIYPVVEHPLQTYYKNYSIVGSTQKHLNEHLIEYYQSKLNNHQLLQLTTIIVNTPFNYLLLSPGIYVKMNKNESVTVILTTPIHHDLTLMNISHSKISSFSLLKKYKNKKYIQNHINILKKVLKIA